jgi:hypothetical protein
LDCAKARRSSEVRCPWPVSKPPGSTPTPANLLARLRSPQPLIRGPRALVHRRPGVLKIRVSVVRFSPWPLLLLEHRIPSRRPFRCCRAHVWRLAPWTSRPATQVRPARRQRSRVGICLFDRARFHVPDLGGVFGDGPVAGELAGSSHVDNRLLGPGVSIFVQLADL